MMWNEADNLRRKPPAKRPGAVLPVTILVIALCALPGMGEMPQDIHHGVILTGPWELLVQRGKHGQMLRFPVTVSQENRPEALGRVLPILGTPVKVKIEEYYPDVKLETYAAKADNAGGIVHLIIHGKNLHQPMFLDTADPQRLSLSSPVGSIRLLKLRDKTNLAPNMALLGDPQTIGLITVRGGQGHADQSAATEQEFVIHKGQTLTLPQTGHQLTVVEYFPHYFRDNETKEEANLSDKPVNPAIKVRVEKGGKSYEQWLWARFPSFRHGDLDEQNQPDQALQLVYSYVSGGGQNADYTIIVSPQQEPMIVRSHTDRALAQPLALKTPYPFDANYHFTIEQAWGSAVLKEKWHNQSDTLRAPALRVSCEGSEQSEQVVLPLGKPRHVKMGDEVWVLAYQRKMPETPQE